MFLQGCLSNYKILVLMVPSSAEFIWNPGCLLFVAVGE